ncbi:MAG TPA: mechanosensitive ion channel domain-containing protein, partial [Pyrinomonadaceae bacterium]|nr:mechanosensitive ion channel domain-containing protein [Pyrinomonadaceae bacterium]
MAAGMTQSHYLAWLVVGFLAATALLHAYVPAERMRLRSALALFVFALVGLFVAAALAPPDGGAESTAYRWVKWSARFIEAVAIINVASVLVFEVLLAVVRLRPPRILRDLLLAATYIVVGIALLSQSGVNLSGIIVTSTVITAAVAFSLQDTLGNVMGGLALQMERTITVGDWIRVGTDEGQVKEIRWRQTSIETRNWDTIVIPNSVLM